MDFKEKVSIWAGILTLAVLQVEDRVSTALNVYLSDWTGAVETGVGYVIGFVIIYAIVRWLLERYLKGKSSQPQAPASPFPPQ